MWIQFLNIISHQKSNVIFFQNKERLERMQKVQLWRKKEKKLGTRLIPIIESNISILSFAILIPRLFIYFFISFLFLLSPFALPSPSIKRIYRERQIRIPTHPGLSTSLCIVNTSCITCLSNNNAIPKDASSSFP